MRKFVFASLALVLTVLSACVTINVYFPAAAAEKAAEQFIGTVIGAAPAKPDEPKSEAPGHSPQGSVLDFVIGSAHAAEADLNIQTPALREIQARMKQRFDGQLSTALASGAVGLGKDALVVLRDAAKVALGDRAALNQAVADDNRDRAAVYREIAQANGHPEWEGQIRSTFAKQWVEQARAGWYYQDASGAWKQR
ncbi:MAG: YdbL family protein [Tahibacter sp.]